MKLSVAYTFEPGSIGRLAGYSEVKELYGCRGRDFIGSGRSAYTLRPVSDKAVGAAIKEAHGRGIAFNYLLNAAGLYGIEQTRAGNRIIRRTLDRLSEAGADAVTVSLPLLLRIVKQQYPQLKVRIGAFATIDSAAKAKQWQDMGADTLCLSAIACNRDFASLSRIRSAVKCGLQLIVNASCMPSCAWEQTHMHLLSQSSLKGHHLKGFCLDYCFLQCSRKRSANPVNYIKSIWIRPEDLSVYEALGYDNFKIVERSCPGELLQRRVAAYCGRKFDGNLWELVAPVAWIKKQQKAPWLARARMLALLARPRLARIGSMLDLKRYAENVIPHDFSRENAPVYIDNRALDGFLEGLRAKECGKGTCDECGYCREWTEKAVRVDPRWQRRTSALAEKLDNGLISGGLWGI